VAAARSAESVNKPDTEAPDEADTPPSNTDTPPTMDPDPPMGQDEDDWEPSSRRQREDDQEHPEDDQDWLPEEKVSQRLARVPQHSAAQPASLPKGGEGEGWAQLCCVCCFGRLTWI